MDGIAAGGGPRGRVVSITTACRPSRNPPPWQWPMLLITGVLALGMTASAREDLPRSPRNASYTLDARLDTARHQISGRGRLVWRNISSRPAAELRFHLYWNAWRDNASTWMRERALASTTPVHAPAPGDAGSIDLTALSLVTADGRVDLLGRARYVAPDDGNTADRTVLAVPLDVPVAPGESIDVDFDWDAHVPRTIARTGVLGSYFFIGQWFPKIGVLEDDGWNCHQFHASTEFFSDYGMYDVRMTVPNGWVVGATGREVGRTPNADGTATHHYLAADVHDFAWTTSPSFLAVSAKFDEPGLPPVDIRLLLQPEHQDQADRHIEAARHALRAYGEWFGPYPYGNLTIVDPVAVANPAAQGGSTGGMEYPTLVTAGTRWITPWRSVMPAEVVIHEIGHQFWYGIVGSNEFEDAWLDEGLTTYATARVMDETYGRGRFVVTERYFGGLAAWPYEDVPWSRDVQGNRLARYRRAGAWDEPSRPSWRYWPASASATTYARTALWLTSFERLAGKPAIQSALASFFDRAAFRHPAPEEFFAALGHASGYDVSAFVDAMYRSDRRFDYAVEGVHAPPAGTGTGPTTVVVRRLRDGVFPVDVRVTFADGTRTTAAWDGRDRWRAFSFDRDAGVRTVEIDPDRVLTLDENFTNNSWSAEPQARAAAWRWAVRWLTWFENVALTYAFFA